MEYADEKIIQALNQYKKSQRGDIYNGIYIKEQLFTFAPQNFFEDRMSIMLPVHFKDMPLEMAKIKYPFEQRPSIIKMNEEGDINFTFRLYEEVELKNSQVKEAKDGIFNIFKKAQPANVYMENKEEWIDERCIGWFDFKSHGLDSKLYQFFYCASIDGKMLQGSFNCLFEDTELWKPIVLQVLSSIKDLTVEIKDK